MPRRLAALPSSFLRTLLARLKASTGGLATLGRDIALYEWTTSTPRR